MGPLKYVRIIIGYNQIWEVDRVEPEEKSSYWWNKTELKKIRNDYREEVMMDGVRALVRTRLQQEEDDPAVIEDRVERIMLQPPNLIAAFLESTPPPAATKRAAGAQNPAPAMTSMNKSDDDESVTSSSSSSSSSENSRSSSSSSAGSDEKDDAIVRRQARSKKEEDTVSDNDIYALFGLDDEDGMKSCPSGAPEEGGKKRSAIAPAATTTGSNNNSPSVTRRKEKPAAPVDEDDSSSAEEDDDASSTSSDCDDSVSISLDGLNVKPPPVVKKARQGAPFMNKSKQQQTKVQHRHGHHHHLTCKVPPSPDAALSPPSLSLGSQNNCAGVSRGPSSPTRSAAKVLTPAERKALVDLFRRAVLTVVALERLGGIVTRTGLGRAPPLLRKESSLVDLYLPSDEERDEVNHHKIARKKVKGKEPTPPGGNGEEITGGCSNHDDENTECPICLGLVQLTQHRKITLLRRMLCRNCFSAHYTSRRENPPPVVSTSPFNHTDKKNIGRLGLYRKNHNRSISPKREAMNRSLSPRREANQYASEGLPTNRTKSLSPTRSHQRAIVPTSSKEEESKPPSFVTRKGRRTMSKSPTRMDAIRKSSGKIKLPNVTPKTELPHRRVRSMSPGRIRDSVAEDSATPNPASISSKIGEESKASSFVTRKGRRPTSRSPTRIVRKKKSAEKGKLPNVGPKTEVVQRRVRSMSPGRVRDSFAEDSPNNLHMQKPASVRKRGSSAEPSRMEDVSSKDEYPTKGRQTVRRGVRPKPVKAIAQQGTKIGDTIQPSSSTPVRTSTDQSESAKDKKRRVKERLAKRRAQQRLDSSKTEAFPLDSPKVEGSAGGGLASFLNHENTAHGVVVSHDDDERTAQSAPL
jgi:hypothetical protein